jgi:hypothetical protein
VVRRAVDPGLLLAALGLNLKAMDVTWHNLFHTVEGLVAVGTIALACVTGGLAIGTYVTARLTRRLAQSTENELGVLTTQVEIARQEVEAITAQAEAARQEVEVSTQALQASHRPVVVAAPAGEFVDRWVEYTFDKPRQQSMDRGRIRLDARMDNLVMPVWNIGTGLALITDGTLRVRTGQSEESWKMLSHAGIPPQQIVGLAFEPPTGQAARQMFGSDLGGELIIRYVDISGAQ